MESIVQHQIIKQGTLGKQGGGGGGHKTWKDRYFVLSDHLYYYASQADFAKDPKHPLGRISMDAYFVSKTEDSANFEFCVNAYPKSLLCRAHSAAEADEWLNSLMLPLTELAGGAKSAEAPTGVSPKAEGAAATA